LFYCSQYCREVHWTLKHNLSCQSDKQKEESTVLCMMDRFSQYQDNKTTSISHNSVFETLPIQMSDSVIKETAEITNDLCYPSSSTGKKKSLKTLLSLLRVNGKRY
jgi:hypothetical protein